MNIYDIIIQLLEKKKYQLAYNKFKEYLEQVIQNEHFSKNTFIRELKGKQILINMTSDKKIGKLFCRPIIDLLLEKNIEGLNNYLLQCMYINDQFEILNSDLDNLLEELKDSNQSVALHKILGSFETLNHEILEEKNANPLNFHQYLVKQKETLYENGMEGLNIILKKWCSMSSKEEFKKKKTREKDIINLKPLALNQDTWLKIVGLKFLYWLIDETSINNMEIKKEKESIEFKYVDTNEYIRYRLPVLRESSLNGKFTINLSYGSPDLNEIDFDKVMALKYEGEHFILKLELIDTYKHLLNSINVGRIESIKIAKFLRIKNLSEIDYKDINIQEAFMFYFCIRNMAEIYYNATEYYISKYKKYPKAPFLTVRMESLYYQYNRPLSKVFKRDLTMKDFEKWVEFFTFGSNNIFDLYYKPLIRDKGSIVIIPSLFLMNNVYMTFIKHLQYLKIDMSSKGTIFEQENRKLLSRANLKVNNEDYTFNYYSAKNKATVKGDIDLLAWDENYLFVAEVKNHLDPVEPEDYRGTNKVLKKAHSQLKKILMYIDECPKEFCEVVGMSEEKLKSLEIVPFIIISGYFRSGEKYEDIQVVDFNSLEKFIDDGYLSIKAIDKDLVKVSLRDEINSEEIKNYLDIPYYYGLEGCYAPMFYQKNTMIMPSGRLFVSNNLPEINWENYKYKELFPVEEKVRELIDSV